MNLREFNAGDKNQYHIEELKELNQQLLELTDRVREIIYKLQGTPGAERIASHASSYWLAYLEMSLSDEHNYIGRSANMQETIKLLEGVAGGEDEEDEG